MNFNSVQTKMNWVEEKLSGIIYTSLYMVWVDPQKYYY